MTAPSLPPEVAERLGPYYVYALIDPRDDSIFYIGKGTGLRLLSRLYAFRGAGGSFRLAGTIVSCAAVQDAQPVVVGVGVAESLAFDLFDDEVAALCRAVGEPGVEVGQDLCFPLAQGAR